MNKTIIIIIGLLLTVVFVSTGFALEKVKPIVPKKVLTSDKEKEGQGTKQKCPGGKCSKHEPEKREGTEEAR